MTEEKPGYIPIFRKFFDHYLWEESREFSKAEAWIDCIQMARYKNDKKKKLMAGNLIEWGYGQFPASVRFLKERWNWGSNTKVENFLSLLESDGMIKIEKGQGQNVITLCNYSIYDIRKEGGKDTGKTLQGHGKDTGKTLQGQNSKNDNNVKNDNNDKKIYTVDSDFEFSDNYTIDYKSFIGFFNEVTGSQCRMTPNKKPDIKKQLKTFTGTEIKQALINRSKALKDSEYLTSWESIFTRKPERMEKYLNLKTSNLQKNGNHQTRTKGDEHVAFLTRNQY